MDLDGFSMVCSPSWEAENSWESQSLGGFEKSQSSTKIVNSPGSYYLTQEQMEAGMDLKALGGGNSQTPQELASKSGKHGLDPVDPMDPTGGKAAKKMKGPREFASKYHVFTWNNYQKTTLWDDWLDRLEAEAVKFAAQEEVGADGTPHIQGAIEFRKKTRPVESQKLPGAHWDAMKAKQCSPGKCWAAEGQPSSKWGEESARVCAYHYCLKDDTRKELGRQWQKGLPRLPRPLLRFERHELRWWQQCIFASVVEPCCRCDRSIRWYFDEGGNIGKSFLTKALVDSDIETIVVSGEAKDVKYAVQQAVQNGKPPQVVILDVPRTNRGSVSYQAIEKIKDGCFFSGKFEGSMVRFNTPHVLVFANHPPRVERFSVDRWQIFWWREIDFVPVPWQEFEFHS